MLIPVPEDAGVNLDTSQLQAKWAHSMVLPTSWCLYEQRLVNGK